MVLRSIMTARAKGHGIVLISHNVPHAFRVGDRFVVLNRGEVVADLAKGDVSRDELQGLMAGDAEIDEIAI